MKKTLKFVAALAVIYAITYCLPVMAKDAPSKSYPDAAAEDQSQNRLATQGQPVVHESPDNTNVNADADTDADAGTSEGTDTKGQPPYTIIAGDVLQITVWKEDGLDQEALVLPGGTISFPLIGSVVAQGLTPAQLQAAIKQKLHKYIPDAAVTVSVKAALGHTVNVIGQVTKPGEFVMGRHLTVMQALSQAGGLTPYASESGIIILRHDASGKEISIPFPYDDVASGDDLDKDIVLSPGDVVVVPTAGLL